MRVFVDTSALIAILDEDDVRHEEASATFRSLVETADLVTHNYIHVEAVAVATRRLGAGAAERLIDSLLPVMNTIWIEEELHRAALTAHRSGGGSVSLVDHVSFIVMRQSAIQTAFAFDADYELQGFKRPPYLRSAGDRRVSEAPGAYVGSSIGEPDLVSVSEIAARAGRPVNTVQSWRRRHRDFPEPVARLAAGPIWSWPQIADWISGRLPRPVASSVRSGHGRRINVLDLAGADVGKAARIPATAEAIDVVIAAGQTGHAAAREQALSGYTHRRNVGSRASRRTDPRR